MEVLQIVNQEEVHIDPVDIATLLAVEFDEHEVLVQNAAILDLKGLAFHHVTHLTRRVTDYSFN